MDWHGSTLTWELHFNCYTLQLNYNVLCTSTLTSPWSVRLMIFLLLDAGVCESCVNFVGYNSPQTNGTALHFLSVPPRGVLTMLLGQFHVHGCRSQNRSRNSGSRPATQSTTAKAGSTQVGQNSSHLRSGVSVLEHFKISSQSEILHDSMDTQFDKSISQTANRQCHWTDYSNFELSDQDRKCLKLEAQELA